MTVYNGGAGADYYNYSGTYPTAPATGDSFITNGGNDTVYAGNGNDDIHLGDGNDLGSGGNGNDYLFGDAGNDSLYGGAGNDYLFGATGNDTLWGGPGSDYLRGNQNDDVYYITMSDTGIDLIQEDLSSINTAGYGGGTDSIRVTDVTKANLTYFRSGNNLCVTSLSDMADGVQNSGVIVENHYASTLSRVEFLYGSDGLSYTLP